MNKQMTERHSRRHHTSCSSRGVLWGRMERRRAEHSKWMACVTPQPSHAERMSETAGFVWVAGQMGGGAGGQVHLHLHLTYRNPDSENLLDFERLKDFQHEQEFLVIC